MSETALVLELMPASWRDGVSKCHSTRRTPLFVPCAHPFDFCNANAIEPLAHASRPFMVSGTSAAAAVTTAVALQGEPETQ